MRLTDEQRAELERRGWVLKTRNPYGDELWAKEGNGDYCAIEIDCVDGLFVTGKLNLALEFMVVAGIATLGYRVVPEEIAKAAADGVVGASVLYHVSGDTMTAKVWLVCTMPYFPVRI